jgi:Lipopolysaccharide-assembly
MIFRTLFLFLGLSLTISQTGCSSYELGGPKPAFTTIEIAPIQNTTSRIGTHVALEQKLIESFTSDPRIKIGTGGAKLETVVTGYTHRGLTTKSTDSYTYSSFNISITVRCTLTTNNGTKVLFKDREFSASATLQPNGDASAEERSIAPGLFTDIVSQIREAATTAW